MKIETLEQILAEIEIIKSTPLTTRQHRLKDWLEDNFESGRYFTIEEICNAGLGYELNTNPKIHDKCVALSNEVKEINWKTGVERYIPIIKNTRGSIKLPESSEELKAYIEGERKKVERHYQYLNHLTSLLSLDGVIPFINLANRTLNDNEIKPVEVFKR